MRPENEAALAELVAGAAVPLRVIGGGTRDIGVPVEGDPVRVDGLSGVSLYEPGALTLVAGAGTPVAEIDAVLAAEGQRLAFEPMDHRALLGTQGTPTIGGVVAANVSGPRRIQVGACRDSALGVRFVDGRGQVLKNGGRVMKNVTGYDLVKLMAGSWGTLGILSEVALKVQAIPETEATLVGRGLDARAGIAALSAALGSPFDISGAAWLSEGGEARLRIEGLADSVAYRLRRLGAEICAGWDIHEAAASAALWGELRDVVPLVETPGIVWRVSVKPSDAPVLLEALDGPVAVCDWGGGLIWLVMPEENDGGAVVVREQVARLGGHATLVRAPGALRRRVAVFQPEAPALAALSRGLRARFDPRGILNPGLMG
ncbi:FAD-binding protein [Thiosulfatihalobacter marinus]|uniref:FAD-binding protein n=1 Tax=Thiosulfatihalobacter marinus TaxID=2792481 RepID=UPI0018D773CD|nr:FAD-binding protein [Thiosulfatihalobacter marinus]